MSLPSLAGRRALHLARAQRLSSAWRVAAPAAAGQQWALPALRGLKTSAVAKGGSEGWAYRDLYYDDDLELSKLTGDIYMTFLWGWMLFHVFTEPEHLFGHNLSPDPDTFTNEELGISD